MSREQEIAAITAFILLHGVTPCPPRDAYVPAHMNDGFLRSSPKKKPNLAQLDGDWGDKDYEHDQ